MENPPPVRDARSPRAGIPRFVASVCLAYATTSLGYGAGGSGEPAAFPPLVVDLNTAPGEVLGALPRVGPTMTERIVSERARKPFESLNDLDSRVRGIGPATIASLRPHLRVGVSKD